jgi:hypothetical protein
MVPACGLTKTIRSAETRHGHLTTLQSIATDLEWHRQHLYNSRAKDGYTVDDMWTQVEAALSPASLAFANPKMTALESPRGRGDGYANTVHDRAIFECTQRKPRADLFSVIPKGGTFKPVTKKSPPLASLSADNPG